MVALDKPKTFLSNNFVLILAIIYVFVRTDLIPDAIPVIGSLDDSALLLIELIRKYVEFRKAKKEEDIK